MAVHSVLVLISESKMVPFWNQFFAKLMNRPTKEAVIHSKISTNAELGCQAVLWKKSKSLKKIKISSKHVNKGKRNVTHGIPNSCFLCETIRNIQVVVSRFNLCREERHRIGHQKDLMIVQCQINGHDCYAG